MSICKLCSKRTFSQSTDATTCPAIKRERSGEVEMLREEEMQTKDRERMCERESELQCPGARTLHAEIRL